MFTASGAPTGGTLTASFEETNPGNSGLSLDDAGTTIYNTFVDGFWDFTSADGFNLGGPNTYSLEIEGNGFTAFTIDANTRILTRLDEVSDWTSEGTHENAVGDTAKRSGLTTLSAQYAFGDDTNCSQPVTGQ